MHILKFNFCSQKYQKSFLSLVLMSILIEPLPRNFTESDYYQRFFYNLIMIFLMVNLFGKKNIRIQIVKNVKVLENKCLCAQPSAGFVQGKMGK